jgi:hypothetical protein
VRGQAKKVEAEILFAWTISILFPIFNVVFLATDPSTKVVTVNSLDIQPMPVLFSGELHLSLNLTINTQIDSLFLDTVLEKHTLGTWLQIPCTFFGPTSLGTW